MQLVSFLLSSPGFFFEFGLKDVIDIVLVALLLYYVYKLMKVSGSIRIFTGILVFILIWLVVTQDRKSVV